MWKHKSAQLNRKQEAAICAKIWFRSQRAVLKKLADGDWHRPARLISARIGYQRVQICLRRLLELGLVVRERIGEGEVRPRYQYQITEAGKGI